MTGLTGRLKKRKGDVSQPPAPEASAGYSPADMPLYKQATAAVLQHLFVLVDRLRVVLDRPSQAARTKTPWPDTAPKVLSAVASQAKECISKKSFLRIKWCSTRLVCMERVLVLIYVPPSDASACGKGVTHCTQSLNYQGRWCVPGPICLISTMHAYEACCFGCDWPMTLSVRCFD